MYDVAARAGVSHQTVSRVVNGFDSIRPATRDRVLAAIAELGYRRNVAARTLATSRTRAIGVLAPAVTDYGPTSTVQGIEVAARAAGYHSLVTTAADDRDSIVSGLGFLLDQAIEALVVIAPQQRVLEALRELDIRLPIATLQAVELGTGTVVSVDQSAGARLVMDHLLGLGHRHIQHLAGPIEFLEAAARRSAYERALVSAGIPVPEVWWATGRPSPGIGRHPSSIRERPPSSRPTTRWRSDWCMDWSPWAGRCLATSASSASTTCRRRGSTCPP